MSILSSLKMPYFIFGGVACNIFGLPRFTEDIDIVISATPRKAKSFLARAIKEGIIILDSYESFVATGAIRLYGVNESADIIWGQTPFDKNAISRAIKVKFGGKNVKVCSLENLILYKIIVGRRQDMLDIENIVKRQGNNIKMDYLKKWAKRLSKELAKPIYDEVVKLLAEKGLE